MNISKYTSLNKRLTVIVLTSIISVMTLNVLSANKYYRYKDDKGKLVVSSTLPPEVSQKGYDIVNNMGIILESVAPRKTQEQLEAELADKAKREEEAKIQKEQEQLDSILMNSYTDISDIERARDNELLSRLRDSMLLKQNIRRLTRMLEDTQTRAARDERLGKEIGKSILKDIDIFKKRIAAEKQEVIKVEENHDRINQRYSSSIIRFNELKAEEQLRRHRQNENASDKLSTITYKCSDINKCNTAWQGALRFANENSTSEVAWANETTIMMRKPGKDTDISIMVSRVKSLDNKASSLVMEIRCNKTQAGEALCNSDQAHQIEQDFIPYLEKFR